MKKPLFTAALYNSQIIPSLTATAKKTLLPLYICLQCLGCTNQPAATTAATATDSATRQPAQPATVPASSKAIDTLHLGDKTFFVYLTEEANFGKEEEYPNDSSETKLLAKDTLVTRRGNSLYFKLNNGKQLVRSNNNDDSEDYINYTYAGNYPAINRRGVYISYYESNSFELINPSNAADTLMTWAPPVISPDKKYILCASFDLMAGFIPNGFQLFTIDNGVIKLAGEQLLEKWGPGRVQWLDNKTVLAEYKTEDSNDAKIRYVKMIMQ